MKITDTDKTLLIEASNTMLAQSHVARAYIPDLPENVISWFEQNADMINGEVVIVRSKNDEGFAAYRRNQVKKGLFLFGYDYWVTEYFTGTCAKITLPEGLLSKYF